MWSISEIKTKGKEAFKRNYWPSVGTAFLLYLLLQTYSNANASNGRDQMTGDGAATLKDLFGNLTSVEITAVITTLSILTVICFLLKIFIFNPLQVGCYRFFKNNVSGQDTKGTIKEGFGQYGHVFATLFLRDLFILLWSLLLIIPGLIKAYSYRMVPYIIKDNPELSATEVISKSKDMMNGNKWNAFLLDLSFIGWLILGMLTLGIVNIFWTHPYRENANAALYLELKGNN